MFFPNQTDTYTISARLFWPSPMRFLFAFCALLLSINAQAFTPNVVVTIKPLHGLLISLMQGTDTPPQLLLPNGASAHHYSLKPSDFKLLQQADIVVRADAQLETFLDKAVAAIDNPPDLISMSELPGVRTLPLRSHHHHGDATHHDPHAWLSPYNALMFVNRMTVLLANEDSDNAPLYAENGRKLTQQLIALDREIEGQLLKVRPQPFIVMHDAYQYFEDHYGLNHAGSLSLTPEQQRGIKSVQNLRNIIEEKQVGCVISEAQYSPQLLRSLGEGYSLVHEVGDPLGDLVKRGEYAYFDTLSSLADAFTICLGAAEIPQGMHP